MRVYIYTCMVNISIKRSCPVNLWNQAKENSKGKDRMSAELNHYLEITRSHVDGLKGFPDAIRSVFPDTIIQLYIVHQMRNSIRYVGSKHQKEFMKDLKLVY